MATVIDLSTLGSAGFVLEGELASDKAGRSVSSAGDVNGDGIEDFIVGAPYGGPENAGYAVGAAYVIYGKKTAFDARIDLASLSSADGFIIHGEGIQDKTGFSVSGAGDVNGDGFDDLIVGAFEYSGAIQGYGEAYLIFGKSGERGTVELGGAHTAADFIVIGGDENKDRLGISVSDAGDFNGDGFDDIVVGAYFADGAVDNTGKAYVIFGHAGAFADIPDVGALGAAGMVLQGERIGDAAGQSVSSAGDVNGDGIDDLLVGAPQTDIGDPSGPDYQGTAGTAYVVFGKTSPAAVVNLADMTAADGFAIHGEFNDRTGFAVSGAGDVNGDGFDDIIVGAYSVSDNGAYTGAAYVLFGKTSGFGTVPPGGDTPEIDVSEPIAAADGFAIIGAATQDAAGFSVSDAGDVNGDGFDDIIIGAIGAEPSGGAYATGEAYVIFGKASGFGTIDLGNLLPAQGFIIQGDADSDRVGRSVSSADVNGDGFTDLLVGAADADVYDASVMADRVDAGEAYVVFGAAPTTAVTRIGSAADQTIRGGAFNDTLRGEGGDDKLVGAGGNDTLGGGDGADDMFGGAGNDTYVVDDEGDRVTETSAANGMDTVKSALDYKLGAHLEKLILVGTGAIDGTGNGLANTITGNEAANELRGEAGNDKLIGNGGNDILRGGDGADDMRGGDGNDTYVVDDAGDKAVESSATGGTDTVKSAVDFTIGANVERLTLVGTAAIDGTGNTLANIITGNEAANALRGEAGSDTLIGNGGNDTLGGGDGADIMRGGDGNDTYVVDNAGDKATETSATGGTDTVKSAVTFRLGDHVERLTLVGTDAIDGTGNALANIVTGNGEANTLKGAGGNDILKGGAGDDQLFGGTGNDDLTGGAGADGFRFATPLNASTNRDDILDFSVADDTIFLDRSVFAGIASGVLAAGAFRNGTAAADASDRIIYDAATGNIRYDADGAGGVAAVLFATVDAGTALTNADFVGYVG